MTEKKEIKHSTKTFWDLHPHLRPESEYIEDKKPEQKHQKDKVSEKKTPYLIPIELSRSASTDEDEFSDEGQPLPDLPARWEGVRDIAEERGVFPAVVEKLKEVSAYQQLSKLIALARNEGYAWVVFGKTGSGKSAFFQTLEHKFRQGTLRTLTINAKEDNTVNLANQPDFSEYLKQAIIKHQAQYESTPLVIVLEGREENMTSEERSSISQALKNTLRSPGPGKNVVFVLPVTNTNHGDLFLQEARETGVGTAQEGLYTFTGPPPETHPDILRDLCFVLNEKNIEDYGLPDDDLRHFVSHQQTIGQYIRTIDNELVERNAAYQAIIDRYGYRPITLIVCFVSPEPAYETQRVIKGLTIGPRAQVSSNELLGATGGDSAKRWEHKRQMLARIIHTLDLRIVEFPPDIVSKLFYAYGWGDGGYSPSKRRKKNLKSADEMINVRLQEKGIEYNPGKSLQQNVRQQLSATNLFRTFAGEERRSISVPRQSHLSEEEASPTEMDRRSKEKAERLITEYACELAKNYQVELHTMIANALRETLEYHSNLYPKSVSWIEAYPEAWLTYLNKLNQEIRDVRADIVIEARDRVYVLEFCWRSKPMTDAKIASYVLQKINNTYLKLPMIEALLET